MNSKNYFISIVLIFFFLSLLGSIFQSFYIYDPFHWGIAQSSIELFSTSKPYKDIFIHYGFLYTLTNSIILHLSNNNLIYTMYISAFFYSMGNFVLCYIAFKNFKIKTAYFLPLILFLIHPFANHPWYNYQFYFLVVLSLFFFLKEAKHHFFFSGLLLSLSCLVYENFIYLFLLLILIIFFVKRNFNKNIFLFIGFLIPQLLFHSYLFSLDLHKYWLKTFWLNEIFLQIYNLSFFELIFSYFNNFFIKSILSFLSEPYYLLFFLIFIFNTYFAVNFLYKKVIKNETKNFNINLFIISIICLFTYAATLHKLNIFRFSTGPIIGIIVLLYLAENNMPKIKNYLLITSLVILGSNTIVPIKQENNRYFPLFDDIKSNVSNNNVELFRSQKWRKETWNVIQEVENTSLQISENCPEINNFVNFTQDAFIYMIAKQHINSSQYLFWYENKKFYKLLSGHFNIDMDLLIEDINQSKQGIIFFNLKDLHFFKKKINLKDFEIFEFPYSYQQKRKALILSKTCFRKLNI